MVDVSYPRTLGAPRRPAVSILDAGSPQDAQMASWALSTTDRLRHLIEETQAIREAVEGITSGGGGGGGGGSEWTDAGSWLEPNTDGDSARVFDSGGSLYADLSDDTLDFALNAAGTQYFRVVHDGFRLKINTDLHPNRIVITRSNGRVSVGTDVAGGDFNLGGQRVFRFIGNAGQFGIIENNNGVILMRADPLRHISLQAGEIRINNASLGAQLNAKAPDSVKHALGLEEGAASPNGYLVFLTDSAGNQLPGSIGPGGAFTFQTTGAGAGATVAEVAQFYHDSPTGTQGPGGGVKVGYYADNTSNAKRVFGYTGMDAPVDIVGNIVADFFIELEDNTGTPKEVFRLKSDGTIHAYTGLEAQVAGTKLSLVNPSAYWVVEDDAGGEIARFGNSSGAAGPNPEVSFFGVALARQQGPLTTQDPSIVNSGDATTDGVINNNRGRIEEIENALRAYGLLQ